MTKEERDLHQNIIRVAVNLGVLLDIGLFPGKHAQALQEGQQFLKTIVDDEQSKLTALTPAPPVVPAPAA